MSDVNINAAISTLGITKAEAKVLDCMDGEKDGQIEQSIFDQAEEILSTVKTAKDGTVLKEGFLDNPVAKAIRGTIDKMLDALKKEVQFEEVVIDEMPSPYPAGLPIIETALRDVVRNKKED